MHKFRILFPSEDTYNDKSYKNNQTCSSLFDKISYYNGTNAIININFVIKAKRKVNKKYA